jgi:prepilin-type N-terminal cleavage/methylation domain-containing protein
MIINTIKKSAFTLIELIFSIVIIGFAVLSLPIMTQVSTKAISNSLAIEAIFLASSKLNQNLSDLNVTNLDNLIIGTNEYKYNIVESNLATDIKRITITVTKASTIITSLNSISCNIKKTKPYHKTF